MKSRNPTPREIVESTYMLIVLLRYPGKRLSSQLRIVGLFVRINILYYSISYAPKESSKCQKSIA
jgi:hypothetical protein